jgi:hypothetical protein
LDAKESLLSELAEGVCQKLLFSVIRDGVGSCLLLLLGRQSLNEACAAPASRIRVLADSSAPGAR